MVAPVVRRIDECMTFAPEPDYFLMAYSVAHYEYRKKLQKAWVEDRGYGRRAIIAGKIIRWVRRRIK